MTTYFNDDGEGYIAWLEANPSGYLLNVGTGGATLAMLHTSRCGHLWGPNPKRRHTKDYTKACAETREALEGWAAQRGYGVTYCPNCLTLPR